MGVELTTGGRDWSLGSDCLAVPLTFGVIVFAFRTLLAFLQVLILVLEHRVCALQFE